jgi:hypothetical protein
MRPRIGPCFRLRLNDVPWYLACLALLQCCELQVLVWAGDFNYRVDAPAGFNPDTSDPERPVNEQLYRFVLSQVRAVQWQGLGRACLPALSAVPPPPTPL